MKIIKLIISLFVFIAIPYSAFARSGDMIQSLNHTGTYDVIDMRLDSENNIYILEADPISKMAHISIYEAYVAPTRTGTTVNMYNSGSVTSGTGNYVDSWIDNFTTAKIYPFINYLYTLALFYVLITLTAFYGLYYGFIFFKGRLKKKRVDEAIK